MFIQTFFVSEASLPTPLTCFFEKEFLSMLALASQDQSRSQQRRHSGHTNPESKLCWILFYRLFNPTILIYLYGTKHFPLIVCCVIWTINNLYAGEMSMLYMIPSQPLLYFLINVRRCPFRIKKTLWTTLCNLK